MVANEVLLGKRNRNFERRNAQTSRAGWRPKTTSNRRLARDIANSMRAHAGRQISDYTLDPEVAIMVKKELGC